MFCFYIHFYIDLLLPPLSRAAAQFGCGAVPSGVCFAHADDRSEGFEVAVDGVVIAYCVLIEYFLAQAAVCPAQLLPALHSRCKKA